MRERIWFSLPCLSLRWRCRAAWGARLAEARQRSVRARRSPSNGGNFSLFQLFTHGLIASLAYQQQPNCSPAQQPAAMDTGRRDPRARKKKINDKKRFLRLAELRRGGAAGLPVCLRAAAGPRASACQRGGKWPVKPKRFPSDPQKVWG